MNPILINECHEVTRRFIHKFPKLDYMDFYQELQVRIISKKTKGKYISKTLLEIFAKDVLRHMYSQRTCSIESAAHICYDPWPIVNMIMDIEKEQGYGTMRAIQLGLKNDKIKDRIRRKK